jgi:predicted transcriptional regulator
MQHLSTDRIFDEIKLLSNSEKQRLYTRMQEEFIQDKEIVAYTVTRQPLTREQYVDKINRAVMQTDKGELLTDEELQREIDTW